jgi:NTE family protein
MHAAFEVGVLTEILNDVQQKRFELTGLSGTSAGGLCALMVWYGLAPMNGNPGSAVHASKLLNDFWDKFVAQPGAETLLNFLTYGTFKVEEMEIPVLGVNAPIFSSLDPLGLMYKTVVASLPGLGVRRRYFDLDFLLRTACPDFNNIDWRNLETRLLIGASEVINGLETVFDSDVNKGTKQRHVWYWRQRLSLSLEGVAAAGTLPNFREAELIDGKYYWDGLYSQNPPVREFLWGPQDEVPDELWIIRVNPQQWPELPTTNADIKDRENELMGNLSLLKELDFILMVNEWIRRYPDFARDHKPVTVRTIPIKEATVDNLRYSSKFNRSLKFMNDLRREGHQVGRAWLDDWYLGRAGTYPQDAAYRPIPVTAPAIHHVFQGF